MARIIAVLSIFTALVGVAVVEQIAISRVYTHMKNETAAIIKLVENTPDKNSPLDEIKFDPEIKTKIDTLHEYWQKREHKMCILIRHIDLSYVSDALIYAKNFVEFDNKEESMAGLSRLEYLLDTYSKMYGFNGLNIL
jgi:molybdopterin-guanine dinucleotide biosynthesis protein A